MLCCMNSDVLIFASENMKSVSLEQAHVEGVAQGQALRIRVSSPAGGIQLSQDSILFIANLPASH